MNNNNQKPQAGEESAETRLLSGRVKARFIFAWYDVWSASKRANQNVIPYRLINGPVA